MCRSILLFLGGWVGVPAVAAAQPLGPLPVVFHVAAADGGAPVASDDELDRSLQDANGVFAAAGVQFRRAQTVLLAAGTATLRTVGERRALRRQLVGRAIEVFVFGVILDPVPSEATRRAATRVGISPSGRLGGAHVPAPGHQPSTYILLSRQAGPLALAHELGHFLGVAHHRNPENIMSYGPQRHRFDEWQLATFRRRALTALRRR